MSDLVDPTEIESLVGAKRHPAQHLGRAVSADKRVYILHSRRCLAKYILAEGDLRDCAYSKALDNGIEVEDWADSEDKPVALAIYRKRLIPLTPEWLETP